MRLMETPRIFPTEEQLYSVDDPGHDDNEKGSYVPPPRITSQSIQRRIATRKVIKASRFHTSTTDTYAQV